MKSIKDLKNLKGKRVLVRLDLNVPIDASGKINETQDWRIRKALSTLKFLMKENAKIIIISHLGRPKGQVVEDLKLGPIQDKLTELLDVSVLRAPDCVGKVAEEIVLGLMEGEILLLENIRFHSQEEKNDPEFAKSLADLGEMFINDAFSDCHRNHASIVGIPKYLPSYAGFLLEKEVEILSKALKNPKKPAVAIVGGAKIETKLPVIEALAQIYDYVLVGGAIANELSPTRYPVIMYPNIKLPIDYTFFNENKFDIGPKTIQEFGKIIFKAKTIIWNGPMGKFEEEKFSQGTKEIIGAIDTSYINGAQIIIGGGETICALAKFEPEILKGDARIHISTGGGAMLEFLAGKKLPGLEALE